MTDSTTPDVTRDPTHVARLWLAEHPDDPVAVHVRAGLDSADRYETLARELAEAKPGTLVVICTARGEDNIVITAPARRTEREVAEMIGEFFNASYYNAGVTDGRKEAVGDVRRFLATMGKR